jgi:hypothetical protein
MSGKYTISFVGGLLDGVANEDMVDILVEARLLVDGTDGAA